jgi:non-specific serine/threonine protein kinase
MGEGQVYRRRYCDYYAALAVQAEQAWAGPDQLQWFERLRGEQSNLRAALDTYLDDPAAAAAGADLAASLWFFWIAGGFLREGRRYLEQALMLHERPGRERRRALWACAFIAGTQGDLDAAEAMAGQCLDESVEAADDQLRACALETLGMAAAIRGDLDVAVDTLNAALLLFRGLAHFDLGVLRTMPCLGITLIMRGDIDDALALARRSHDLCQERGERWQRSYVDYLMALAAAGQGRARTGVDARPRRDRGQASVPGHRGSGHVRRAARRPRGRSRRGRPLRPAARRGQSLWHRFGLPSFGSPFHSAEHLQCVEHARRLLGGLNYTKNFQLGEALNLPEMIAYALCRVPVDAVPPTDDDPVLTRRESQVAALIAEGLSNREIADRLFIAKRTVDSHVEHILEKLGFRSRTQIAAWLTIAPR